MKQAAFLTPYLDVLGGAELYLLNMAKVLAQHKYRCVFFWSDPQIKSAIIERFGPDYQFIDIDTSWSQLSALGRLNKTHQFDLFVYDTDGSYFFSLAKKNYASIHVPDQALLPQSGWRRWQFSQWQLLFNSRFTKQFFENRLSRAQKAPIIYPMSTPPDTIKEPKAKLILSVGRFFARLHSKKQELLIKTFIKGQQKYPLLKNYRLVLAGSYKVEDSAYLRQLETLAHGHSAVEIRPNLKASELSQLYQEARFYWHAAGYGIDDKKEPKRVEHFGTTIVEAMLNQAVPLAYKAGGPKEIITHGYSGFLYQTPAELLNYTLELIRNHHAYQKMQQAAFSRALTKFGPNSFQQSVQSLIDD